MKWTTMAPLGIVGLLIAIGVGYICNVEILGDPTRFFINVWLGFSSTATIFWLYEVFLE